MIVFFHLFYHYANLLWDIVKPNILLQIQDDNLETKESIEEVCKPSSSSVSNIVPQVNNKLNSLEDFSSNENDVVDEGDLQEGEERCIYNSLSGKIEFVPPLYIQRYLAVMKILKDEKHVSRINKIAEYGCAEFHMFRYYKTLPDINKILFVDIDEHLLRNNNGKIKPMLFDYLIERNTELCVQIYQGDVCIPDIRFQNIDAVIAIELIEHLYDETLNKVPHNIFGIVQPYLVIITTPNGDFNYLFDDYIEGTFRHYDHKFEWTRQQFRNWAENIIKKYPMYKLEISGIGPTPKCKSIEQYGHCSQMAIFTKINEQEKLLLSNNNKIELKETYTLIEEIIYPVKNPETRSTEQILFDEITYNMGQRELERVSLTNLYTYVHKWCNSVDHLRELLQKNFRKLEYNAEENEYYLIEERQAYYSSGDEDEDVAHDYDQYHKAMNNKDNNVATEGTDQIEESWDEHIPIGGFDNNWGVDNSTVPLNIMSNEIDEEDSKIDSSKDFTKDTDRDTPKKIVKREIKENFYTPNKIVSKNDTSTDLVNTLNSPNMSMSKDITSYTRDTKDNCNKTDNIINETIDLDITYDTTNISESNNKIYDSFDISSIDSSPLISKIEKTIELDVTYDTTGIIEKSNDSINISSLNKSSFNDSLNNSSVHLTNPISSNINKTEKTIELDVTYDTTGIIEKSNDLINMSSVNKSNDSNPIGDDTFNSMIFNKTDNVLSNNSENENDNNKEINKKYDFNKMLDITDSSVNEPQNKTNESVDTSHLNKSLEENDLNVTYDSEDMSNINYDDEEKLIDELIDQTFDDQKFETCNEILETIFEVSETSINFSQDNGSMIDNSTSSVYDDDNTENDSKYELLNETKDNSNIVLDISENDSKMFDIIKTNCNNIKNTTTNDILDDVTNETLDKTNETLNITNETMNRSNESCNLSFDSNESVILSSDDADDETSDNDNGDDILNTSTQTKIKDLKKKKIELQDKIKKLKIDINSDNKHKSGTSSDTELKTPVNENEHKLNDLNDTIDKTKITSDSINELNNKFENLYLKSPEKFDRTSLWVKTISNETLTNNNNEQIKNENNENNLKIKLIKEKTINKTPENIQKLTEENDKTLKSEQSIDFIKKIPELKTNLEDKKVNEYNKENEYPTCSKTSETSTIVKNIKDDNNENTKSNVNENIKKDIPDHITVNEDDDYLSCTDETASISYKSIYSDNQNKQQKSDDTMSEMMFSCKSYNTTNSTNYESANEFQDNTSYYSITSDDDDDQMITTDDDDDDSDHTMVDSDTERTFFNNDEDEEEEKKKNNEGNKINAGKKDIKK